MDDQHEDKQWLTVRETAARLNTSEEMVRRKIRASELPASRLTDAARAPWMINAATLERQLEVEAHRKRVQEAGIVVGRGDEGGPHDQALIGEVAAIHGSDTAEALHKVMNRHNLFDRIERDMYADPAIRERFETLDDDERFEEEARELARRIRRAERLRDRALEILGEEDE
jgi:hypothetical protein